MIDRQSTMPPVCRNWHGVGPPSLVMVVEDMPLIAMGWEDVLTEAGYAVLGPVASVAEGLTLLEGAKPDAAILDVNLGKEKVTPIAYALAERNIPFVLTSGTQPEDLAGDPILANAENLGKPTSDEAVFMAVHSMLSRCG